MKMKKAVFVAVMFCVFATQGCTTNHYCPSSQKAGITKLGDSGGKGNIGTVGKSGKMGAASAKIQRRQSLVSRDHNAVTGYPQGNADGMSRMGHESSGSGLSAKNIFDAVTQIIVVCIQHKC